MAGTVELATAYVSLVPSAQGIGASVAKELAPVEAAAGTTGAKASSSLGSSFLGGLKGVSGKALGFLGFAGIGVAAFKSAEDVEAAQNIILRSTGATGKAADGLEASFKNIAKSSPAAFDTIASTLSEVYQRTGLTGAGLEGLTKQVVTFNRITKDAPITVTDLTKALAGFNVPAGEMGATLDKLFNVSQKTGVPLADLISTLNSAGPIARQFGFDVQKTAGLLAQLNKAGIDASSVMPALKKAFANFAKEGRDPAEALRETLGQLEKFIKAGDDIGANDLAVKLFGARGAAGFVDAVKSGKLSLDDLKGSFDETGKGILDTAGATGTLGGKLGVLKNQAKLALAEIGAPILHVATDALAGALPVVSTLGEGFAKIAPALTPGIFAFLAFKAVSVTLVPLLGVVQSLALQAALGLGAMGASGGRTTAFLAGASGAAGKLQGALPAVAAGGFLLADSWDDMGTSTGKAIEGFAGATIAGAALGSVVPGVGTAIGAVGGAAFGTTLSLGKMILHTESLEDKLKKLESAAKGLSGSGKELVTGFINKLIPAAAQAAPDLKGMATSLFAFRSVAEQSVGTAARLAHQFEGTDLGKGMEAVLRQVSSGQRQLNEDQRTGSLVVQGYDTDSAALVTTLSDLQSAVLGLSDAHLNYNEAVKNVAKATEELRLAEESGDPQAIADATDNLARAQSGAANATLSLAQQQEALSAKYKDRGAVDQAIADLQHQQELYPETAASLNPLIYNLLLLRAKYDDVANAPPAEIHVTAPGLDVTYQQLADFKSLLDSIASDPVFQADGADPLAAIVGARAGGGPVWPGTWLVGEQGPELLTLDSTGRGRVTNAPATAAMLAPSSSSGAPLIGQLLVQAPTDDPVRLAYETARKIDTRRHLAGV